MAGDLHGLCGVVGIGWRLGLGEARLRGDEEDGGGRRRKKMGKGASRVRLWFIEFD